MKIHNLKDKLFSCLIFAICLLVLWAFQIPCPTKWLTEIPCPGCGMTRAYIALVHLNLKEAFRLHPMFWSMPILVAYFFKDYRLLKTKWVNDGILILIGLGFIVQWIVKIIFYFRA